MDTQRAVVLAEGFVWEPSAGFVSQCLRCVFQLCSTLPFQGRLSKFCTEAFGKDSCETRVADIAKCDVCMALTVSEGTES